MPSKLTEPLALIADIGGTNARFARCSEDGHFVDVRVLPCAEFPSLPAAIEAYLGTVAPEFRPRRAAIDVACPVEGDYVTLTNRNWSFSIDDVRQRLGFSTLDVVNDFEAIALALPFLATGDRVQVGCGSTVERHPIVVLGPGTGLGVSTLVHVDDHWIPIPGEGGHVTLSAASDREAAIVEALRKRFGHASAERALSGPGLVNLFSALCYLDGLAIDVIPNPSEIVERGLAGTCPVAGETLAVFFRFLGTIASNLAVTLNARGGVYLAGGILPRIVENLAKSEFRKSFENKGRFSAMLRGIPTFVVTHPTPAFVGLARLIVVR